MPLKNFNIAVRSEYASEAPSSLLQRSVQALSGVSEPAAAALKEVGISTILDLAASGLFNAARRIVEGADMPDLGVSVAGDLVDSRYRGKSGSVVADAPLTALRGLGGAAAAKLKATLGVETIRDLANWAPFLAATAILQEAYGMPAGFDADPERPDDLVPVPRRYATERVQYDIIVMDRVLAKPADQGSPHPRRAPAQGGAQRRCHGRRHRHQRRGVGGTDRPARNRRRPDVPAELVSAWPCTGPPPPLHGACAGREHSHCDGGLGTPGPDPRR
jgi:predicted flap endonuclease-1-like 5' DNA nuclease